ncbi:unnamed protein product, partial [Meganyctiphanes norvegica]
MMGSRPGHLVAVSLLMVLVTSSGDSIRVEFLDTQEIQEQPVYHGLISEIGSWSQNLHTQKKRSLGISSEDFSSGLTPTTAKPKDESLNKNKEEKNKINKLQNKNYKSSHSNRNQNKFQNKGNKGGTSKYKKNNDKAASQSKNRKSNNNKGNKGNTKKYKNKNDKASSTIKNLTINNNKEESKVKNNFIKKKNNIKNNVNKKNKKKKGQHMNIIQMKKKQLKKKLDNAIRTPEDIQSTTTSVSTASDRTRVLNTGQANNQGSEKEKLINAKGKGQSKFNSNGDNKIKNSKKKRKGKKLGSNKNKSRKSNGNKLGSNKSKP